MSIREERSQATRAHLINTATELFAARGYADVGTEDVVRAAGLTRGALYHHFADKRELFAAVHEQQEAELVARLEQRILEAAAAVSDPIEQMAIGVRAFLDACTEPAIVRIALLDAPTVLGWQRWREVDSRYGLGLMVTMLRGAMDLGVLRRQDPRPLAHLMLAALGEAALLIANADDPHTARAEVEPPLISLLKALAS